MAALRGSKPAAEPPVGVGREVNYQDYLAKSGNTSSVLYPSFGGGPMCKLLPILDSPRMKSPRSQKSMSPSVGTRSSLQGKRT
jgi:hypothetical protein